MDLNSELDDLRKRSSGDSSAEYASAMGITEEIIRNSRLVETALREGDVFPEFSLPDSTGSIVQSADLLARGPLIVSFYRGGWCPFCNLELNALQLVLPEIKELGGALVAVSPETPEQTSKTLTRFSLSFYLLSDHGNALARKVGLVYRLPAAMQAEFRKANIYLPAINGDDSWELPPPATYLIGQDRIIREAFVDDDYYHRKDPRELVSELKGLRSNVYEEVI